MYQVYTLDYVESMKAYGRNDVDWDELYRLHCKEKQEKINEEHRKAGHIIYDKAAADRIRAEKAEATRLSIEKSRAIRAAKRAALIVSSEEETKEMIVTSLVEECDEKVGSVNDLPLGGVVSDVGECVCGREPEKSDVVPFIGKIEDCMVVSVSSGDVMQLDSADMYFPPGCVASSPLVIENLLAVEGGAKVVHTYNYVQTVGSNGGSLGAVEEVICDVKELGSLKRFNLRMFIRGYDGPLTVIDRGRKCWCPRFDVNCVDQRYHQDGSDVGGFHVDAKNIISIMGGKRCCDGAHMCENCPRVLRMHELYRCACSSEWQFFPVKLEDSLFVGFSPWWHDVILPDGSYKYTFEEERVPATMRIGRLDRIVEGYFGDEKVIIASSGYCPGTSYACIMRDCYLVHPPDLRNLSLIIKSKVCCGGIGCENCPRVLRYFPYAHCTCFEDRFLFFLDKAKKFLVCLSPWWSDVIDPGGTYVDILVGKEFKVSEASGMVDSIVGVDWFVCDKGDGVG